ncbi:sugar phosphate nucleotidyltransferase [Lutimonas zeaxanthinifaciens]|uniref:sugar phosphate nucleotidyltransferase n=1 Tax=Lutimonas zeaxanthinifaciens TaxID=3060215 RepID=UPI00265D1873|nr:sugar phosphate nucleotidyltransferase [Lutimonas sp. YSD2104]WKK66118.1 sugar phosphate nucleotidyltransferase [Lutimonas sp. YSD2104]
MGTDKPTLVILAAGIGSRYGGLKQLDTFTPEGDTIIDFSIYDALQAGFGKFVFIIRKSIEKDFRAEIDPKLAGKAEVAYVFQELDRVPEKYFNPDRVKPYGTGHAMLMAKDAVKENFAIINADDFYGREAFVEMAAYLQSIDKNSHDFSMMAYLLKNTISEHGFVSRGECAVDDNGFLTNVVERTHIEGIDGDLMRKDDDGGFIPIDENTVVSMNFWGFTPKCFEYTESLFDSFLEENKDNLKSEYFIPLIVNGYLENGTGSVKVLTSDAKWFGVTYKEDKESVQKEIQALKEKKVYPRHLW